jgi:hypothetical protein
MTIVPVLQSLYAFKYNSTYIEQSFEDIIN